MADIIRDAPLGQLIRYVTSRRFLQYADERPGFVLPTPVDEQSEANAEEKVNELERPSIDSSSNSSSSSYSDSDSDSDVDVDLERATTRDLRPYFSRTSQADAAGPHRTVSRPIQPTLTSDGTILVDWYSTGEL
jgi:DHA1 family multidrug resistance protein-like MFS transporter